MFKILLALSFVGLWVVALSGCLATLPQNQKEARVWAHSSSDVVKKEYKVPTLTLDAAEAKLRAFSAKCLAKEVTHTSTGTTNGYPSQSSYSSKFIPKVVREPKRVSLFLQRYAPKMNMIGTPKDGRYDFVAEITPSNGGVAVFSARMKVIWNKEVSLGNILEDLEAWMLGKGQFCPEVN